VSAVSESDVNEDPFVAADNKKAAFNARFNTFDGLLHETDGSSYNKGDGIEVRGVNKFV